VMVTLFWCSGGVDDVVQGRWEALVDATVAGARVAMELLQG